MNAKLTELLAPNGSTRYLFFGGKGGVGKTTLATATAVWFADNGYRTTIVSTDPTVSLSAMFEQEIGGVATVGVRHVPNLCGLNINAQDAKGVFQNRLTSIIGQASSAVGLDAIATPCAEEMATFDQFVSFLDEPEGDVVVFDTAPTGKTLRELAMPFDWAGYLAKQIQEGKALARLMNLGEAGFESLDQDRRQYEGALAAMRDPSRSVFTLVLLPERLPIEETKSAIAGLTRLGIPAQAAVINQVILPEVIGGNRFLAARASLQERYLAEIDREFAGLVRSRLPLLETDVSNVAALRRVADLLYGEQAPAAVAGVSGAAGLAMAN